MKEDDILMLDINKILAWQIASSEGREEGVGKVRGE